MINYDRPEINVSLGNGFLDGLQRQLEEIARENGEYVVNSSNENDMFDNFNNN